MTYKFMLLFSSASVLSEILSCGGFTATKIIKSRGQMQSQADTNMRMFILQHSCRIAQRAW